MMRHAKEKTLTHERLLKLLRYDERTGEFYWRVDRPAGRNTRLAGEVAGSINTVSGYKVIVIDHVYHYGHRLAVFYVTGTWPAEEVDHRDLNRANNAWSNLRLASKGEQRFNQGVRKDSRTGVKGVSMTPEGRYKAKIKVRGKAIHLGHYDTLTEAQNAYEAAAKIHAGEFSRKEA